MRLGWGLNNPAFCKMFTCRFIPEADTGARAMVRRAAARVDITGKRRTAHGARRRYRCPAAAVTGDGADAGDALRSRSRGAAETRPAHRRRDPDARYVSLPSANHLMLEEEPAWAMFLEELGLFLNW